MENAMENAMEMPWNAMLAGTGCWETSFGIVLQRPLVSTLPRFHPSVGRVVHAGPQSEGLGGCLRVLGQR